MIRSFNGKAPVISERVYIDEMASVIGDVELGESVNIWPEPSCAEI